MRTRPAGVEDAAGIATIHVRSWQAAYRGQLPDDVLDNLSVEQRRGQWEAYLHGGGTAHVAVAGRRVLGFVSSGPSRDGDATAEPAAGEVYAIYADPSVWGTGAGRALMDAAIASLAGAGFDTVTLWVLEGNERARRFYEAAGWAADGARKDEVLRGAPVVEVRYRRNLHP